MRSKRDFNLERRFTPRILDICRETTAIFETSKKETRLSYTEKPKSFFTHVLDCDALMTITVETASMRNSDRLHEIERDCFKEEAFSRQQIANLLMDYNTISLIAVEKSNIIGFIIGTIHFERKALDGHVLTIDVTPPNQRRGIGQRLLQEIEKIFSEKEVKTCHLEVREDNVKALSLYEKAGYRIIGKLKNYYGKADGLYLRKNLAQP